MLDLANDPKTLNISTGPTFRQKGEALYKQFLNGWIPPWMYLAAQNIYGTAMWRQSQWGLSPSSCALSGILGGVLGGGIGPS